MMTMLTLHCADCGELLGHFGMCPFADPMRARVERMPVNCGHTAAENAAVMDRQLAAVQPADCVPYPKLSNFMGIAGDQSGGSR
jgi:hypothetical protein